MRSLLETAFRELPKQIRGLRVPLDLLLKFLKNIVEVKKVFKQIGEVKHGLPSHDFK